MPTLASSAKTVRFGVFELDLQTGELRKQGVKIHLQGQPIEVLKRLVETPGELVTREDLRTCLWSTDTFVDFDQGLNNSIQRIREVLGDSAQSPRFIETIPKRGYRFISPVAFSPDAIHQDKKDKTDRTKRYVWYLIFALVAILICAGGALWTWKSRQVRHLAQVRAIAVLPLENLSGDPAQEFFSDGITDELITEVAHLHPLRVISRTSVMRYKATRKPLPEIARELDVDAILEGSVVRSEQQVRVTAQLIEARTDNHLWSAEYTREIRDVISLQREITGDIARQIRLHLLPEQQAQLETARSINPAAYEAYLKGRTYLDRMTQQASGGAATQYFEKSIELDPTFAPAYAFLADSLVLAGGNDNSRQDVPRARAALAKALELDPSLSTAHSRLGIILLEWDWDWKGAEREIKRALELNPNDRQNHYAYARYLQVMRRREEALVESDRALELDPLAPRVLWLKASILSMLGRCEESNQFDHKALALDPDFRPSQAELISNKLHVALIARDYDAADQILREKSVGTKTYNERTRGKNGTDGALARFKITVRRQQSELGDLVQAEIYSFIGDRDAALELLEQAHTKHSQYFIFSVTSSDFDNLRSDPRYQALMHRINFPL